MQSQELRAFCGSLIYPTFLSGIDGLRLHKMCSREKAQIVSTCDSTADATLQIPRARPTLPDLAQSHGHCHSIKIRLPLGVCTFLPDEPLRIQEVDHTVRRLLARDGQQLPPLR